MQTRRLEHGIEQPVPIPAVRPGKERAARLAWPGGGASASAEPAARGRAAVGERAAAPCCLLLRDIWRFVFSPALPELRKGSGAGSGAGSSAPPRKPRPHRSSLPPENGEFLFVLFRLFVFFCKGAHRSAAGRGARSGKSRALRRRETQPRGDSAAQMPRRAGARPRSHSANEKG